MRCLLLSLVVVLGIVDAAEAGGQSVRGRILSESGKPVRNVQIATAWMSTANGLQAREPVTSDADGNFSIERKFSEGTLTLLAVHEGSKRGALFHFNADDAAKRQDVVIAPMVRIHGEISTSEGKYYPERAALWLAPKNGGSALIGIELVKGNYSVLAPAGEYEFVARSPQTRAFTKSITLKTGGEEVALGKVDLPEFVGRVQRKERAPPIVYQEGHPDVDALLRRSHFPNRWTLCYFWAHR